MGRISLSALGNPPVSFLIWDQTPTLLHDDDDDVVDDYDEDEGEDDGKPPVSFLIWDQAPNLLHDVDDKEDEDDDHTLTASTSFFP